MNPKFFSRRPVISQQELVNRLKTEGPESLKKADLNVMFEQIWQDQPDQMKKVLPNSRKKRTQVFVAFILTFLLIGTAAYTLNESKSVPAKSDISGIDFRNLVDIIATKEVKYRGEERIEDLSTPLNIVIKNNGVTLKLVKAYYDGGKAKIDYIVETSAHKNPLKKSTSTFKYELKLIGVDEKDQPFTDLRTTRTLLDQHHFAGTLDYSFSDFNGAKEIKFSLKAHELANTSGDWHAEFSLNSSKADAQTFTFFPNQSFKYQGHRFNVDKIKVGPLSNVIQMTRYNPQDGSGVEVSYSDNIETLFRPLMGGVTDMGGNEDGYTDEIFSIEPFSTIYRKPTSLFFDISTFDQPQESGTVKEPFDGRLPITLEGFDGDKMILTHIEYRKDSTIVRLKYNSPNVQSWTPYFVPVQGKEDLNLSFKTQSFERISKTDLIFEGVLGPVNPEDIAAFAATTYKAPKSQERFEIPLEWSHALKGRQ
ncbi:DUF4179 domain-containing protein [Saccharibacillus qingshengii]|uniref:DUF4179 domain-containing protein n=1 Tax=Saccharibacillus qingshengii TaxID=1763540 RepID=UPI00155424DE|nr:DUF4179 domain-containing protein [Saccharibacillus qingshengii]